MDTEKYILRGYSSSKKWINDDEYILCINLDVQKVTTIDKVICELIIS